MSSQIRNQSHDLRLLSSFKPYDDDEDDEPILEIVETHNPELFELFNKVKYDLVYGTEEETKSGLPKHIHNVSDAAVSLEELIRKPNTVAKNEEAYAKRVKAGDMHIYYDGRPSEFHTA